jgi:hypothetical protein
MSISSQTVVAGPFVGNGAAVAFPFTIQGVSADELAVYADGVLLSSSLYTVSISRSGGTVTFTTAPANGVEILIVSDPAFESDLTITDNGPFLPSSVENSINRGVARDLLLKAKIDSLLPDGGLLPGAGAGQFHARDADGLPVFSSGTGTDPALRTDLAAASGGALVAFTPSGTGAVSRPVQTKLREGRSIADYGAVSNLTTNNSDAFDDTVAALPTFGGAIHVNGGNYRGNYLIDQDCVILRGDGGCVEYDAGVGFHGAFAQGLRPYATGAGTATMTIGGQTQKRVGLHDLAISGDAGNGVGAAQGDQAEAALRIKGGVTHMSLSNLNLRDGTICLDMDPSDNEPITCNFFSSFDFRNEGTAPESRTVRLRRHDVPPDPAGEYFTANHFLNGHLNGPLDGYCVEVDGGTSPGIGWQVGFTYCDIHPGKGVLLNGASWIEAWDLTLDPGTTGAVVAETTENPGASDITSYLKGYIKHGGQKFKWGDGSTTDIPSEAVFFMPGARLFHPFLSDLVYLTTAADPFNKTRYWDFATNSGPYRLNGIKLKVMDATDSTSSTTGAFQVVGGVGVGKSLFAGDAIGSVNGYYTGANKVVGARGAAVADATDAGSAITQLNLALARLRAHGLIET